MGLGENEEKNNSLLGNFYAHAQCTRRFRFSLVEGRKVYQKRGGGLVLSYVSLKNVDP